MTDKTQALRDLLAKVETGKWDRFDAVAEAIGIHNAWNAEEAFCGSLNAAKALHDAVMPNHAWDIWRGIGADCVRYYGCNLPGVDTAYHADPARAWLIAILRALIAQAEQ